MNLFKGSASVDERIVHLQNKIYREIYMLVLLICIGSIVVKTIIHGVQLGLVVTELVILFSQGVYYAVRSANLGVFSAEVELHDRESRLSMNKKNIIIGLAVGVVIALFFGIRSAIVYGEGAAQSFSYFGIVFLASLIMYVPVLVLILVISHQAALKRSERAIERELEEDEESDQP
ncbi:DUF6773 family protein [Halalkalibacter oceani]|uniref:DUF6773 family protein n=1 Tax=Halalkalibacter oceani TaxID=1653776 RepID=UPI003396D01C